jgi:hypothetical protein
LIVDITNKLHNLQGRGRKLLHLEMEILVRRIEKTRTAVHELFQGMDIENNDDNHSFIGKLSLECTTLISPRWSGVLTKSPRYGDMFSLHQSELSIYGANIIGL